MFTVIPGLLIRALRPVMPPRRILRGSPAPTARSACTSPRRPGSSTAAAQGPSSVSVSALPELDRVLVPERAAASASLLSCTCSGCRLHSSSALLQPLSLRTDRRQVLLPSGGLANVPQRAVWGGARGGDPGWLRDVCRPPPREVGQEVREPTGLCWPRAGVTRGTAK